MSRRRPASSQSAQALLPTAPWPTPMGPADRSDGWPRLRWPSARSLIALPLAARPGRIPGCPGRGRRRSVHRLDWRVRGRPGSADAHVGGPPSHQRKKPGLAQFCFSRLAAGFRSSACRDNPDRRVHRCCRRPLPPPAFRLCRRQRSPLYLYPLGSGPQGPAGRIGHPLLRPGRLPPTQAEQP